MARSAAARQALGRLHPCLPVPRAERLRLLIAFHWAVSDLKAGGPPQTWSDACAAALVALHLVRCSCPTAEIVGTTETAHTALDALRLGRGSLAAAVGACGRFAGVWEALLEVVPLRRLEEAKRIAAAQM